MNAPVEYHPTEAYLDGYQNAIDPGWPGHLGTPEFELGFDDGLDLRLGNQPLPDDAEQRLEDELACG